MEKPVWEWEPFHHVSNEWKKSVQGVRANTKKEYDKYLEDGSKAVLETRGFYIYQKDGITHVLAKRLVRVEEKYFGLLLKYLKATNGKITLKAKHAFESHDMESIKDFLVHHQSSE